MMTNPPPIFGLCDDWSLYQERLSQYFIAYEIGAARQAATLIASLPNEIHKVLRASCFPDSPTTKTFAQLCEILRTHFTSQICVFRERQKFYDAKQAENEGIIDWLSRLKQLAIHCDFGGMLSNVIRDKFITGLTKGQLLDKALELDATVTLDNCIQTMLRKEASIRIQFEEINKVSKIKKVKSIGVKERKTNSEQMCYACGKKNHDFKKCKYRQYTCKKCNHKGHLAVVCRKNEKIHFVEESADELDEIDTDVEEEEEAAIYNLNCNVENHFNVDVLVNNKKLCFQIDSGSAVTVMAEETFLQHFNDVTLSPISTILKGYAGETIRPLGKFIAEMKIGDVNSEVNILVVKNGNKKPLIGRDAMKIFKIDIQQVNKISLNSALENILKKFSSLFDSKLGKFVYSKINLKLKDPNVKPKFIKARTVPLAFREKMDKELDRLEKLGIITPIKSSEWATPLVPILKGNGELRVCADYKITVNPHLENVNFPLPKVEEILAALEGGQSFTKLDLKEAYFQFELDDETKEILVWNTHKGLYTANRLPYGPTPNTSICQEKVGSVLAGLKGVVLLVDDILVTGRTDAEHIENLEKVLTAIQEAGFKLNKGKCVFFQPRVKYLGHVIDADGLHKDPEKIIAIVEQPRPANQTQVRAFIGMINYYAKFIPNLATILTPLFRLLRKDIKFEWTKDCEAAFKLAKSKLTSEEVLVHFDSDLPVKVMCDASSTGIGACMLHKFPNGNEKPIAFASRTLSKAEKNYSMLDKEALAIYFAVKKFHYYLLGRKFTLQTDHKPLIQIFGEKRGIPTMAAGRLQRWSVFLSNFDFNIEYIKGSTNYTADCLSRLPINNNELDETAEENATYINFINDNDEQIVNFNQIKEETSKDPVLCKIMNFMCNGWIEHISDSDLKPYHLKRNELTIESEILMWGHRVVVPKKLRKTILRELHGTHAGMVKMKCVARSYVWWPNIDKDIENWSRMCEVCIGNLPNDKKSPIVPWKVAKHPYERIHIDFLGPLNGKMYLVILDAFSKWPEVFQMNRTTSEETVEKIRECCSRFGIPDLIVSDNGPQLTSAIFEKFCEKNGIKHLTIAPYHPSSNGAAENAVKSIKSGITKAVSDKRNIGISVQTLINRYLMTYRSTAHSTTNESPYKLMFNREMVIRLDKIRPRKDLNEQENQPLERKKSFFINEKVLARDYRSVKKSWSKARVIEIKGVNTFIVKTIEGLIWKRHTDQLRKWRAEEVEQQPINNENHEIIPTTSDNANNRDDVNNSVNENSKENNEENKKKSDKKRKDKTKKNPVVVIEDRNLNEMMRKINKRRHEEIDDTEQSDNQNKHKLRRSERIMAHKKK